MTGPNNRALGHPSDVLADFSMRLRPGESLEDAIRNAEVAVLAHKAIISEGSIGSVGPIVRLLCADGVKPEGVSWHWDGYLPAGKLALLAGPPGSGKTTLAIGLAAILSSGGIWPDGTKAKPGNVIVWSGEDGIADTLRPRFEAAGADLRKVFFADTVKGDDGESRAFDPASDIALLEEAIFQAGGAALILVDPLVSAITGDSHKNAEVRRALQPLVDLGVRTGANILGITHLTKGTAGRDPLERVTGSLAFGALARTVLLASRVKGKDGEPDQRVFIRCKSNIGPDDGGFSYDLEQVELPSSPGVWASRVRWGEAIDGTAREILAESVEINDGASISSEPTHVVDAWILQFLADGPKAASEAKAEAIAAGFVWRTVQRRREALGVKSRKGGMAGGWVWYVEDASTATKMPKAHTQFCSDSSAPSDGQVTSSDREVI